MSGKLVKLLTTKMGNAKSKSKNKGRSKHNKHSQHSRSEIQTDGTSAEKSYGKEENPEIKRLRNIIKNYPEVFILNNLMMCIEFFKNYDEEMCQMRETLVSPRETILNNRLLPQKRVLLPDVLQERIARNVTFISRRETVDPTMEPLQPVRMFVVYENIEVSDQHDSSQYSSMHDTVTYNIRLRPSKHKGYVQLERMGITPSKRNPSTEDEVDLASIAEDGGAFPSARESLYNPSQRPTSLQSRALSISTLASSLSVDSSSGPSYPLSLVASTSLVFSKSSSSMPDLRYGETPATSIYNGRLQAQRNKLDSSTDEKGDTDYGSLSESRFQSESTVSKRAPGNYRRGISRNRQYSRIKRRSASDSPASSTSSGYKSGNYDSDSDYGYSALKSYSKQSLDPSEMPDSCFCQVTYTQDDQIYDPIEERKRIVSTKERRIRDERNRRNYVVCYLNSSRFRRRFYNVFIESLALPLELTDAIKYRPPYYFGSVIYCDQVEVSTVAKCNISESYEIIPCVWTQWPESATEWLDRPRNSWPSYETIKNCRKFGCYIIPQEFGSKEDNSKYKIEWQLSFPAAERYLETCMSHAQMRVYIIVLMLHKTFIRAVESAPDRLNTHQIRNQLFWLIENTSSEWPEHRTGDYLLKLLNCLCNCINQTEAFLKDYFLREKNLFQNSEKGSLFFSLKQLKRILGNPVMYVLHAMENIRYKTNFFPKLNYEELLRILTADELLLINPNLEKNVNNAGLMEDMGDDNIYNDRRGGFWNDAKKKKEQFATYGKKPVTNRTLINPSRAHDTVVDIAIRCGELKGIRLSKLLNFFIEHLIEMAKNYHAFGALQQKMDYLHHAMNLCILLADDEIFQDEARTHIQVICALKDLVIQSRCQDDPPETPRRNPEAPSFSSPSSAIPSPSVDTSTSQETFEGKKVSDSSIFSRTLKDRYSSISNRSSIPWPDSSASSSLNNSPQMKKKSDPPVFVSSLKDRYPIVNSERSSLSVPIVEERKEISTREISLNETKRVSEEDKIEESKDKVVSFTDEDAESIHDTYI
ncbi:uncharacterized protein LOC117174286 [Belonocnema kinseyi]|uniref:uncharacterized protein LOC117174286 n=1 Tax=Belonocnema kinseyi TaxID=2817044 RepID=UPI00143CDA80|nr:uncharacterized protein LOC117174286 [Belonocnema kinseyi]XP_033219131.1 uncharacterized protein LOC117174286 [Belonocnema kinseyi]XP_033219132.1 uncharacterized protein LOC117174286 [Belonocnema kinseyi]